MAIGILCFVSVLVWVCLELFVTTMYLLDSLLQQAAQTITGTFAFQNIFFQKNINPTLQTCTKQ